MNKNLYVNQSKLIFRICAVSIALCLFSFSQSFAQVQKTISGIITAEGSKESLPGVNVKIKGKNAGVISNSSGIYNISAASSDILIFSYVGFQTKEVQVDGKTVVNIALRKRNNDLGEVIVIGYGTTTKSDLTGSVATVKMADLEKAPVVSFDQALAGRVAGVQVSSNDGQPGDEGVNIIIRGAGSLTQSSAPLYVVDGFPIEDFNTSGINTNDIETINILKDASATAIYGSRGANGVVIIETKKGKIQKPVVTYNGSYGIQSVMKKMDLMNPYDFVRYQIDRSNGAAYLQNGQTLESFKDVQGIDWQDLLFKTGRTNIQNIAIRGGNKETLYSLSGSLFGSDGVIIETGSDRYQGRISLEQTISKKLKVGVNANYSKTTSYGRQVAAGESTSFSLYLLYGVWGYRPITSNLDLSLDDFQNDLSDESIDQGIDYRINPILAAKNEYNSISTNNLITNAYGTYNINNNLSFKVTAGLNNILKKVGYFYNSNTTRGTTTIPVNNRGQWGGESFREANVWSNENMLTYKKKLSGGHNLGIVGAFSLQKTNIYNSGHVSVNVANEELGIYSLGGGKPFSVTSQASVSSLQSFLTRVNYDYKSKYLFTASFRADGSSKFSKDNRWGYFPSGAFAWKMSQEKFMNKLSFISEAKLRVSYGLTGNNRVGDFSYLPTITPTNAAAYPFNNQMPVQGILINNLGNSDLKWETTGQFDLGYDLSLFNNRVQINADIYSKITRNLLLDASLPYNTGYISVYRNVGKLKNEGLELTLNTINIRNKEFFWESNFNISFNRNKILSLNDDESQLFRTIPWDSGYRNTNLYISKVGGPAGQFYGYEWDGIYQLSDFDEKVGGGYELKSSITTNGNVRGNIQPGDIKYKDLNGDLIVNESDQTIIGSGIPKHLGGFLNKFGYKGFSLDVFFQWSYGNDVMNANRLIFEGTIRQNLNQYASYNDRWTLDNQSNEHYRVNGQGPTGRYSSKVIEDASYLRLKTVSLNYTLPKATVKKAGLANVAFSISAQNLYTWTNYSGMDPEVSIRNSILTPGFDYSAYPHSRTIVVGINAAF